MPVRVGLVGAGPWARFVQAPMLAGSPETALAGVWARRAEAAAEIAAEHGIRAYADFEDLLAACDAVAFGVAPDAQAALAPVAARAGKALLLEKPLALDLPGAEAVASAVAEAGVASLVMLTYRYVPGVRAFLAEAPGFGAYGGRACFLSGAFLGGPFASSPWRQEHGALLDVGPHVIDLLDAALGPVVEVRAAGDPQRWVSLALVHDGGAASDAAICCRTGITESRTEVELFGPRGELAVDARVDRGQEVFASVARELALVAAGGRSSMPDAAQALRLQRIIASAQAQLRR